MKNFLKVFSISISLALSFSVHANQLAECMIDSMNVKERRELVKWVYFGISAHPEFREYTNISNDEITSINHNTANILSRLLIDECFHEFEDLTYNGADMANAFGTVMEVSMKELINNRSVYDALGFFFNYLPGVH